MKSRLILSKEFIKALPLAIFFSGSSVKAVPNLFLRKRWKFRSTVVPPTFAPRHSQRAMVAKKDRDSFTFSHARLVELQRIHLDDLI